MARWVVVGSVNDDNNGGRVTPKAARSLKRNQEKYDQNGTFSKDSRFLSERKRFAAVWQNSSLHSFQK